MLAAALDRTGRIGRVAGDDVVLLDAENGRRPFAQAAVEALLDPGFHLLALGQRKVAVGQIEGDDAGYRIMAGAGLGVQAGGRGQMMGQAKPPGIAGERLVEAAAAAEQAFARNIGLCYKPASDDVDDMPSSYLR